MIAAGSIAPLSVSSFYQAPPAALTAANDKAALTAANDKAALTAADDERALTAASDQGALTAGGKPALTAASEKPAFTAGEKPALPVAGEKATPRRERAPLPRAISANMPLSTYRGVAARVRQANGQPMFELTLLHADPAHCVPLATSCEAAAVAREWRAWGEALRLPLIAIDADGSVHGELNPLGPITAERPSPRRKGSPLVGRRSRFGRRRRAMPVPAMDAMPMRAEREIIART